MTRAARAVVMAMRVAGDEEGDCKGGKGDGNGDKGVRQGPAMATKRAMATAKRVVGEEEGEGCKGDGNSNKGGGQ
jgi:hypothetical protein